MDIRPKYWEMDIGTKYWEVDIYTYQTLRNGHLWYKNRHRY